VSQRRESGRLAPPARLLAATPIVVGVLLAVLSVVPRWIVHERELGGAEQSTEILAYNAWHGPLLPPLIGVALALVAGALALARFAGVRRASIGAIFVAELLALAALVAFAWPIAASRDALDVSLTPGWATWVAIGLAAVGCGATAPLVSWRPRRLVLVAGVAIVLGGVLVGGRAIGLRYDTGSGERNGGEAAMGSGGAQPASDPSFCQPPLKTVSSRGSRAVPRAAFGRSASAVG
jgi:hypothetical protein